MTKKHNQHKGGFTLIELITVLVILGILAAVITPKYFDLRDEAQKKAANAAVAEGMARFNMAYAQNLLKNDGVALAASDENLKTITGEAAGDKIDIGDYQIAYTLSNNELTVSAYRENSKGKIVDGATADASKKFDWPETSAP